MCYPVCGMMHITEFLLLIGKSSPCGSSRFHLLLFEWSFTIILMPYIHKENVLSVLLNKALPSFTMVGHGRQHLFYSVFCSITDMTLLINIDLNSK